jgi:hypothetical protein
MNLRIFLFLFAGLSCAQAAAPTIFETLDPVRPDETLLLFGADVTPQATAEGLRLADDPVSAPPEKLAAAPAGKPAKLEMLQATDLSAKVLIPKSWKPGVYAVRVRNADGPDAWQFANRPQLWWQMSGVGGKANPGGELRVFGKNFGPQSRLWLVNDAGKPRELKVSVARDYDVTATLPANLPTGSYRLWLHNGHGGMAGFGEPLALEVAKADAWPTTVYNVHDYGAKGDNQNDDTYAIRRALAWAGKQGGGVVYLPRGTYIVTGKLVVPERVTVRGEARDAVVIKVPFRNLPPLSGELPIFDALIAGNGFFGIESLTIVAQPVRRVIAAPDVSEAYAPTLARWRPQKPMADRVVLKNLRIQHLYFAHRKLDQDTGGSKNAGPSTIAVQGADFTLEDSDVVSGGMPIQIQDATRARICRNRLRTGKGWYGLWNFYDGVFEENDIAAGDLIGGYGSIQGNAFHILFRGNHWHDGYGGDREALTFDTPYFPAWMGQVTVTGKTLSFEKPHPHPWPAPVESAPPQLAAVILGGRGVGQFIPVAKILPHGVLLEHPFAVAPDRTSVVAISARKSEVLIVDNSVSDASVGVQLFYMADSFLIARNTFTRTGGSYSHANDFLDSEGKRRISYSFFNQWIDNRFEEGLVYDQGPWPYGYVGYTAYRSDSENTTPAIGDRFVGNTLLSGTQMGAISVPSILGNVTSAPVSRDAIFEKNDVAFQAVGITIDPGHWFTFLRENQMKSVAKPIHDKGSYTRLAN